MTPTFTVELLSFPGVDSGVAAARLAGAFQLPLDRAVVYVAAVPVKIKSGATPELAQLYMRSLLHCGAQLRVTNEQSGERVVYNTRSAGGEEAPKQVAMTPEQIPSPEIHESTSKIFCPTCGRTMATGSSCPHCGKDWEVQQSPPERADTDEHVIRLRAFVEDRLSGSHDAVDTDYEDVIDIPPPPGMDKVRLEDAATLIRKASGETAAVRKRYRLVEEAKGRRMRLVLLVLVLAVLAYVLATRSGTEGAAPQELPPGVDRPSLVPEQFRLIAD